MVRKVQRTEEFEDLKRKIPSGARSVQVQDSATGKTKYKPVDTLNELDVIMLNKSGIPIVMKKSPGKVKKVTIEPATPMTAEIVRMKNSALASDPVLAVARLNPEDPDVLHQIVLALGLESASIGFERYQAELRGEKTSELSMRRVNSLKAMADTWLKRKDQVVSRGIDMSSPAYRILMKQVFIAFQEALISSGVRPELAETIFSKLSKTMGSDEWAADTKQKIHSIV